jgi:N-hydroxyarylamine O-acetyltransferase
MNETGFDIDAYCRRIGFSDVRTPTLETLHAIHLLHPQAIAFENLDVLLGRGVRLDADSLQRKMVQGGRGGYCFEQNSLLFHALTALGFAVTAMMARVRYQVPDEVRTGQTHMLLRVDIEGVPYIADVGFGGNTMTGPLRLDDTAEQATPHGPFRLCARAAAPARPRNRQLVHIDPPAIALQKWPDRGAGRAGRPFFPQ